jgi:hypothetical protein
MSDDHIPDRLLLESREYPAIAKGFTGFLRRADH